ncbi:MAG: tRNA pseudouridine(55) synthase TruB [Pirellulaceae bacterium]
MFGVLAVNKPPGLSSRMVVGRVARLIGPHRVGHTGTLDPLATGVLLLAIGQATRLVEFSHLQTKSYEGDFLLGHTSETLDTEGNVRPLESAPLLTRTQLEQVSARWIGKIKQVPPKFSAIHIGGQRAYDLARKGHAFDVPEREVEVQHIEVLDFSGTRMRLRIDCGTGTYIRTLGSDIARALDSDAVMCGLTRTRIGKLTLDHCVDLESLASADVVQHHLHSPRQLVDTLTTVTLSPGDAITIRNGIPIELEFDEAGPISAVDADGELVAILTRAGYRYRSLRVFQNRSETPQPISKSTPHNPES